MAGNAYNHFFESITNTLSIDLGHVDQEWKNLQSTQNGAFPYTLTHVVQKYLYIMYDYDSNAILVHTFKTKQVQETKMYGKI